MTTGYIERGFWDPKAEIAAAAEAAEPAPEPEPTPEREAATAEAPAPELVEATSEVADEPMIIETDSTTKKATAKK